MQSFRLRVAASLGILFLGGCGELDGALGSGPDADVAPEAPRTRRIGEDALHALGVEIVRRDDAGAPIVVRALERVASRRGASPEEAARTHAARLASAHGLLGAPELELRFVRTLRGGGAIVGFRQRVRRLAIHGGELAVHLRADGSLLSVVGRLYDPGERRRGERFALAAEGALEAAVRGRYGVEIDATTRADKAAVEAGAWAALDAPPRRGLAITRARARRAYVERDGALEPAYVVEHFDGDGATNDARAYRDVVHAATGETLERRDLTADDAFTYRVYADEDGEPLAGPHEDLHPLPSPPYLFFPAAAAPTLHTVETRKTLPLGAVDPWLPAGAVETLGNHADAYADLAAPDGFGGSDLRAAVTSPGVFDHAYDLGLGPLDSTTQQMAAITHAFYVVNALHDLWYEAGFDEALGNAQADNYGRGGLGGDRMRVEVQDGAEAGSRDNANMSTPGDGSSPRMQIYLWNERRVVTARAVDPTGPDVRGVAANQFGPMTFDVTAEVVEADDGTGATADACTAILNDVSGAIALVDRGACNFVDKVARAEAAGAIGVLVVNNGETMLEAMGGTGSVTIPAVLVPRPHGEAIRDALGSGVVLALRSELEPVERDAALDSTIVQHEWGHYLHNRLAGCGAPQCRALSEGFGDFVALHAQLRAGDDPAGAYGVATHATGSSADPLYFGIRRVPYSTDPAKNALSLRHIADGEPLPTTHPLQQSSFANAEVHNAGELWATALFEVYGALLEAHPFDEARRRMARAVVASLLLHPGDATYVEARDALLEALAAEDGDDALAAAAAFADRGLGSCAVAPARTSETFAGVAESFELASDVAIVDVELDEVDSCDQDGLLDAGESGVLRVTLANTGALGATPTLGVTAGAGLLLDEPSRSVSLPAFATTVVELEARVAEGVTTAGSIEIAASATPATSCPGGAASASFVRHVRIHADIVDGASEATRFQAGAQDFELTGENAGAVWSHVELPGSLDGAIVGIDASTPSDTALVTPALAIGGGPFVVTLTYRHRFEASDGANWDGLVLEYSTDDGATWADVSGVSDLVYPGAIQASTPEAEQALLGRPAFVGTSAGYPELDTRSIDFGTALAGESVLLRFRLGTDAAVGDEGFDLRELAIAGATSTPFRALVDDAPGACAPERDAGVGEDGGVEPPAPEPGEDGGATPPTVDAGVDGGAPAGGAGGGCGCTAARRDGPAGELVPLAVVALALARRRRRHD